MGIRIREIETWPMSEVQEYIDQYNIEPWGEDRADIRTGYAAAITYNLNRPRRARALAPKDFLPDYRPKKRQTAQEMENMFRLFANAHNARLENGKSNKT